MTQKVSFLTQTRLVPDKIKLKIDKSINKERSL